MMVTHLFRDLHHGASPLLLLPNAWDAGSARLFESVGAPAIGTTSAGLCWSRGYADGNAMPAGVLAAPAATYGRMNQLFSPGP